MRGRLYAQLTSRRMEDKWVICQSTLMNFKVQILLKMIYFPYHESFETNHPKRFSLCNRSIDQDLGCSLWSGGVGNHRQ